jgi:urease subunit gamma/beta
VHLTPHEQERLLIHVAADVAEKRRERGLPLNYPETMALLTGHILEAARDGRTVSDIMDSSRRVLTRGDVMEGVPEMIKNVQVEATFPDGTKLVTVHDPLPEATEEPAIHPGKVEHPKPPRKADCPVGCDNADPIYCCEKCDDSAAWYDAITFNKHLQGSGKKKIKVRNTGDRPIQVGSHYHFAEVNPYLKVIEDSSGRPVNNGRLWRCDEAKGRRLNIAAGMSVRFEPGDECCVELVEIEGYAKGGNLDEILGLRKGFVQ